MVLAVIGGSGLFELNTLQHIGERQLETAYGSPSAPVLCACLDGREILFLARHGRDRHIAPHAINYRANIAALAELGATHIVTVSIVGGISPSMGPGSWVVPDQIIDYTWGRAHSFHAESLAEHVEFSEPYDASLSARLTGACVARGLAPAVGVHRERGAVYGCTQGPRLETAAEIRRMERDGCDIVGMTAMPEAVLARERGMAYASLCLVVNWAAGKGSETIDAATMRAVVEASMPVVPDVLSSLLSADRQAASAAIRR